MKTCLLHIDPLYKKLHSGLEQVQDLKLVSWSSMGSLGSMKEKFLDFDLILCAPYYNTPQLVKVEPPKLDLNSARNNLIATVQILKELLHYNKVIFFLLPSRLYQLEMQARLIAQVKSWSLDAHSAKLLVLYANPALFERGRNLMSSEDVQKLYAKHSEAIEYLSARTKSNEALVPEDATDPYSPTIGLIETVLNSNAENREPFRVEENKIPFAGIEGETKRIERLFKIHYGCVKSPPHVLQRIDKSWELLCRSGKGSEYCLLLYKNVHKALILVMPLDIDINPRMTKLISLIAREAKKYIEKKRKKPAKSAGRKKDRNKNAKRQYQRQGVFRFTQKDLGKILGKQPRTIRDWLNKCACAGAWKDHQNDPVFCMLLGVLLAWHMLMGDKRDEAVAKLKHLARDRNILTNLKTLLKDASDHDYGVLPNKFRPDVSLLALFGL